MMLRSRRCREVLLDHLLRAAAGHGGDRHARLFEIVDGLDGAVVGFNEKGDALLADGDEVHHFLAGRGLERPRARHRIGLLAGRRRSCPSRLRSIRASPRVCPQPRSARRSTASTPSSPRRPRRSRRPRPSSPSDRAARRGRASRSRGHRRTSRTCIAGGATAEEIASETALELGTLALNSETTRRPRRRPGLPRPPRSRPRSARRPTSIELAGGGLATLRVDSIDPPALIPLAEVRDRVAADWTAARTAEALTELADGYVAELDGGLELRRPRRAPRPPDRDGRRPADPRRDRPTAPPPALVADVFAAEPARPRSPAATATA